ncbi:CrcB protein [Anaeromyxobacter sp. Fw109-5]|nr:CrcB protein [Anaeromyxobacter sp. Fw109-5]
MRSHPSRDRPAAVIRLLLVCAGGALGSGARYLVSTWAARALGADFPRGTLIVNVLGSFLLALLLGLAGTREAITPEARLFLGAGVLGGFTTYSSFNYETLALLERGVWPAAVNVALTVLGCLAAGFAGIVAARALAG